MIIPRRRFLTTTLVAVIATAAILGLTCCTKKSSAQTIDLRADVKTTFGFVAYGDTRFHDPADTEPANPTARLALVQAIALVNPAFICFTGDIVYNGFDTNDWKVWDSETSIWRKKKIPVYPALGNHDLHGDEKIALGNYFQRFPGLKGSRYYSVRAANTLLLVLDSSQKEVTGAQGAWLADKLDHVPVDVNFVFLIFHHPPYTSSSDEKLHGGDTRLALRNKRSRRCSKNDRRTPPSASSFSRDMFTTTNGTNMVASLTLCRAVEGRTRILSSECRTILFKARK